MIGLVGIETINGIIHTEKIYRIVLYIGGQLTIYIYTHTYTYIFFFWSQHSRSHPLRSDKNQFQEAVDIVLKFPNPSDAADALVKDKMVRFRSEELIKNYGRCYDVNRICQRYRYLNVVVLQITSLSLSLFGSLYIYTCTSIMYNYAHVDSHSSLELRSNVTGGKIPMDTTGVIREMNGVMKWSECPVIFVTSSPWHVEIRFGCLAHHEWDAIIWPRRF